MVNYRTWWLFEASELRTIVLVRHNTDHIGAPRFECGILPELRPCRFVPLTLYCLFTPGDILEQGKSTKLPSATVYHSPRATEFAIGIRETGSSDTESAGRRTGDRKDRRTGELSDSASNTFEFKLELNQCSIGGFV